jgi:hypothetical protein
MPRQHQVDYQHAVRVQQKQQVSALAKNLPEEAPADFICELIHGK